MKRAAGWAILILLYAALFISCALSLASWATAAFICVGMLAFPGLLVFGVILAFELK